MTPRINAGIVLTAQDATSQAFDSVRRNLGGVQQQAAGLGDSVSGLAGKFGTIGVALSAAFAGASLKGMIDVGDELNKLSQKTGIAVKELSALRYAGDLAGVPLEALSTGFKKLAVTMTEAAGGGEKQARVFSALGISLKGVDGTLKGSDKVLGEIADKFAGFADGPEKAALAVKIFGKAGADMIPLLNQGSAGLREMREEAKAFGVLIGEDFARASEQFNDNLRKVGFAAEGVKVALGGALLGSLNDLLVEMATGIRVFGSFREALVEIGLKTSPFASWAESAKQAREEVARLEAEMRRLQSGQVRTIGENGGGAAFVGQASGVGSDRRIAALQSQLAATRKQLEYFELLQNQKINAEAARMEDAYWGPKPHAPNAGADDKAGAAEKISAYDRINKSIQERIDLAARELEVGRALTEQEKFENKVLADVAEAKGKISAQEVAGIKAALERSRVRDTEVAAQRESIKAALELAKARAELHEQDLRDAVAHEKAGAVLAEGNDRLRDEIAQIGMNTEQQAAYVIAKNETAIALKEEQIARMENTGTMSRERIALEEDIRLLQERNGLLRDKSAKSSVAEALKESQAESQRFWEDIYRGLSDSLYRGFEAGKGFFKSFWDGVKNTLKSTVLRVGVQGVMNMSGLASLLGPTAQVASGIGAGGIGSILNAGSVAGGATSFLGAGAAATMQNGLFSGFGANMANISTLLEGGSYATALSAAFPYLAVAGVVASVVASAFGKGGGPKTEGGYIPSSLGSVPVSAFGGGSLTSDSLVRGDTTNAQKISEGISAGFDGIARQFGLITDKLQVGVFYALDNAEGGTSKTQLQIASANFNRSDAMGGIENVDRGDAAFQAAVAESTADLFLTELQTRLTGKIGDYFKSLDPLKLSAAEISAAISAAAAAQQLWKAFDALGPAFQSFSDMTVDATAKFIAAGGGMEKLGADLSSYFDNYYSDAEKRQNVAGNISTVLATGGVNLGSDQVLGMASATDARQQFRALVEQFAGMGPAGQTAVQALLSVNGAFASLTESAGGVGSSIADATGSLVEAYRRERSELESVRDKLKSFMRTIADFRSSLLTGEMSALTPAQRYSQALAEYTTVKAQKDAGSISALEKFPQVAQTFLEASRDFFGSSDQYTADFNNVVAASEDLQTIAGLQLSAAEQSLTKLDLQVSGLIDINNSVQSVLQAIERLGSLAPAGSSDSIAGVYQSLLGRAPETEGLNYWNSQLASGFTIGDVIQGIMNSPEYQVRQVVPQFAAGGWHEGGWAMVGEKGPELAYLPPARIYNARDTVAMQGGGEIARLEACLERQQATLERQQATLERLSAIVEHQTGAVVSATLDVVSATHRAADKVVSGTERAIGARRWAGEVRKSSEPV